MNRHMQKTKLLVNTSLVGILSASLYLGLFVFLSILLYKGQINISDFQKDVKINIIVIIILVYVNIQFNNNFEKQKLNYRDSIIICFILLIHSFVTYKIEYKIAPNSFIFNVILLGPICEELLLRGVVFHVIYKLIISYDLKYKDLYLIISNAAIFSFMHTVSTGAINLPFTLLYTFIYGILFTYYRLKTANIIIPIILHMFINIISYFIGSV